MHSYEEYRQILELWEQGAKKKRIAIITGINRATVRECIERYLTVQGLNSLIQEYDSRFACYRILNILKNGPEDAQGTLFKSYAYLLGIYLGDGCISKVRHTYRLRIACDTRYPNIISLCIQAISDIAPINSINTVKAPGNCVAVSCYSSFWPRFFPQHGAGRKHDRLIILEDWQHAIIQQYPQEFMKGLIHTDGCRTNNIVHGKNYPRYEFCNYSTDIRKLFSDTCDLLHIHWKAASMGRVIQIARRRDVEYLDHFIGPKS